VAQYATTNERQRDAERKRKSRSANKLVVIPPCADKRRRIRLEKDDVAWLMYYFGPGSGSEQPFTYEFTVQQREMIGAIKRAIVDGDDQALAASRGEGKTILFERMLIKYTLSGVVGFSVLFAATGSAAQDSLESIKAELENNDRLHADYPEVCEPIRKLENTPNRAHYQTAKGKRHDNGKPFKDTPIKYSWCGQEVFLPRVPGSPASGAIIATRGLDSAVRGLKKKGRRVEVAGIDDPDTEDTARSEEQATKLETRIDRAIAGLGGQQRRVTRVMLTTLQNRRCVSFKFTDPTQKPSWKGKRFRFLISPPERADLWEEYVALKRSDWESGTNHAHEFYIAKRDEMDAGADVANPNRYTHGELSALQHYYNQVARIGPEAVATEYDNDPPEEEGPVESGITATHIQKRLSGYPRRMVPPDSKLLSCGIDVQKAGLHWVVKSWRADATNYVIDYGFFETHGTTYGSDEGLEFAIKRAILGCVELPKLDPYLTADGAEVPIALTLVDSGWQAPAVYQACVEIGLGIYPAKGHGRSHGCTTVSFHDVLRRTADRKPGDGWFLQRQKGNIWLVHCDTDRWKSFEHARWMTPEGKPGASYIFGEVGDEERKHAGSRLPRDAKEHFSFAKHLTAEIETEDVVRGKLQRIWKVKAGRVQNHYLDASYLADVAAAMQGIRLLGDATTAPAVPPPNSRPTMAQLAGRA
jgi:hypothetical protein